VLLKKTTRNTRRLKKVLYIHRVLLIFQ